MHSNENAFSANAGKITTEKENEEGKKQRYLAGFYIIGLSGAAAAIAGFVASHLAKKKGREYLKDLGKEPKVVMESPHSLALRALAWGTVWAVGVCSLSVFGLWKWFNIKDLDDLRTRIRKRTRKSPESEGRTEFENLSDFLNYLNETSSKKSEVKGT